MFEHIDRDEMMDKLREALHLGDSPVKGPFGTHIRKEYLGAAIEEIERLRAENAALRAEAEKNEPLTEKELAEMEWEPIYLTSEKYSWDNGWTICRGVETDRHGDKWLRTERGDYLLRYGDVKAYRRKPKEGEK